MHELNALLIIDVQNDFCPEGKLPVKDGDKVIPIINRIQNRFYRIIATQDWHPENHLSFAKNHPGKKVYDTIELNGIKQTLWPVHCVAGTEGARFHPGLNTNSVHLILRKGFNPQIDSYSAFMENDKKTHTGLANYLRELNINKVYLCGLATDYCVFYSALDAVKLGFETYLLIDACRGVDFPENSINNALTTMRRRNIKIINSHEL